METKSRHYEYEGAVLDVPLYYDRLADMYIEEYRDFKENPVWTSDGYPLTHAAEDDCPCGDWDEPQEFHDCGSCRYFSLIASDTLIGVCRREMPVQHRRKK